MLVAVYVFVVLLISITPEEKSETGEDCHFSIVPTNPFKVNSLVVLPGHITPPPANVPPTV